MIAVCVYSRFWANWNWKACWSLAFLSGHADTHQAFEVICLPGTKGCIVYTFIGYTPSTGMQMTLFGKSFLVDCLLPKLEEGAPISDADPSASRQVQRGKLRT